MVVTRIQLDNTEFEGRNNVYLLDSSKIALIDTGVATPHVRSQLEAGLAESGVAVSDLDVIFLTHWHADHAGLAGEFQEASGATVYAHEADAPLVTDGADGWAQQDERQQPFYGEWGLPPVKREELRTFLCNHQSTRGRPTSVTPLEDGQEFTFQDVTVTAIHLPGHTAGSAGFVVSTADGPILFAGDALLPRYTPNVGGADVRVDQPLDTYFTTLDTISDREFVRAYPGHRDPVDNPTARATEIIMHHRERAKRVLTIVRDCGPVDAWTVSAHLFGDLE